MYLRCLAAGLRRLQMAQVDPNVSLGGDEGESRSFERVDRLRENGVDDTLVFGAREGLRMKVQKPRPPISVRA